MVELDLGLVQQGRYREAERRHTKAHDRDHYMAKVLFGEWNEKIIELDGGKINDVEFQDKVFGVYPLKSEVSNRLWAKR